MDEFIRALPKAELHVHLEGSVETTTLIELNPSLSRDSILARYAYADFRGFLDSYKWVTGFLCTPQDYALITRRLLERLDREGVVHVEINISAGVVLWRNQDLDAIFDTVTAEAARYPISTLFIFDAVRQFGVEAAWAVARRAVAFKCRGVAAFGIGGDELAAPASAFRPVFDYARSHGLRLTPHAGETGAPASIRDAIECGADRIGHGIAAAADPGLMRLLVERDIPLEVCVSSNLATGVVASLDRHPLRILWDAGVPIVLNSDDPPMFHTTLLNEYLLAARHFGFDREMLLRAAQNSLRYSFRT
ncbi:MAG TPA: adenosine deaminase [Bryobacteraceae bacterium]|nr:adenosine deaminase [Bryobacteraceae bacterium]HPT25420.1 adenosine deaminase [Bryobacteraceae bacterium]